MIQKQANGKQSTELDLARSPDQSCLSRLQSQIILPGHIMLSYTVRTWNRGLFARSKTQKTVESNSTFVVSSKPSSSISTSYTRSTPSIKLITSTKSFNSRSTRLYAAGAPKRKAPVSNSTQDANLWQPLRSMMEKDDKASKNDVRNALKQLKEQDPAVAAEVLKMLSAPLPKASTASISPKAASSLSLRESKMGPMLEESLARLIEVTFDGNRLGAVLKHLPNIYPEWRADGWDNVIERLIANKNYDSEVLASILGALPREIFCNYKITLTNHDMIYKYQSSWRNHDKVVCRPALGTQSSPLWPAAHYGRILGLFAKKHDALEESASITAHLALEQWSRSTPLGSTQSYEAFVSSIYFAGEILANIVHTVGGLKNPQIASFLQVFNAKLQSHLKSRNQLVKDGFNTFEYLEWVSVVVAETSKLRGSRFNDLFLIKRCLDAMLDKWGSDDVALVSGSISRRFSVSQFVTEALEERKASKSS